jgi:hypothetical protein
MNDGTIRHYNENTISNEIHNPDIDGLSKLLEALDPWLPQIVIVGGWAHRLFRYHHLVHFWL